MKQKAFLQAFRLFNHDRLHAKYCFESFTRQKRSDNFVTNHCGTKSGENFVLKQEKTCKFSLESFCETKKARILLRIILNQKVNKISFQRNIKQAKFRFEQFCGTKKNKNFVTNHCERKGKREEHFISESATLEKMSFFQSPD